MITYKYLVKALNTDVNLKFDLSKRNDLPKESWAKMQNFPKNNQPPRRMILAVRLEPTGVKYFHGGDLEEISFDMIGNIMKKEFTKNNAELKVWLGVGEYIPFWIIEDMLVEIGKVGTNVIFGHFDRPDNWPPLTPPRRPKEFPVEIKAKP